MKKLFNINLVMPKKILVIDDNEAMSLLMDYILRFEGYDVTCKLNGKEGLESMRILLPDLIILDWLMPHYSGEKVLAEKHNDITICDIPTIILTGMAEAITLNSEYPRGHIHVIEKPFDHDSFINLIKESF